MELYREYGIIDNDGALRLYNRDQLVNRARTIPGTNIELVIYKRSGTHTDQQRKYYFSVVVPEVQRAMSYLGDDRSREEIDTMLREMFLFTESYNAETDTWDRSIRRLNLQETDVTIKEFSEFVRNVVIWAVQTLDWAIAFPNEIFTAKDFTESQIMSIQKK